MKLNIINTARHRNGVAGAPFKVVLFKRHRERAAKVGILFDAPGLCAVLDITLLAAGDIAFGSNSWRGDDFEPSLRQAIADRELDHAEVTADNARRAKAFERLVTYGTGSWQELLIDLLTDAQHWCAASGEDFHAALAIASAHFTHERINNPKGD